MSAPELVREPLVSVVITAYDRPALVLNAIRSVRSQTYKHIEIIVVDDCSPVDIEQVISTQDGGVTVVRNATNSGPGFSRNVGIARARGDIVAFLDDDDEWLPNKLAEQLSVLREADACLCGYEIRETGEKRMQDVSAVTAHHLRQGNPFCGASGLAARRCVFDKVGFDEALWSGQDWDIYVQIVKEFSLKNVSKSLFIYRRGGQRSLSNWREEEPKLIASRLAKLEKNRAFLGEFYFGVRVAGTYLRFLGTHRGKIGRILLTMRKAGVLPTAYYLYQRLMHRNGLRLSSS